MSILTKKKNKLGVCKGRNRLVHDHMIERLIIIKAGGEGGERVRLLMNGEDL